MTQNTERNLLIGGVILLLLFLLLRHQATAAPAAFAPPLPDEEKITPGTFSADDYPLDTIRHPQVPSLEFMTSPPAAPVITISPPNFEMQNFGPVNVDWPRLTLHRPTYEDINTYEVGPPTVDLDGIGSYGSYFPEDSKDFTLIGFVPACEC